MESENQEGKPGSEPGYTSARRPRYKECLKNHAVSIAGNAVDGCGEFIPAGKVGTMDSLRCAACNCHRNFHRKEIEGEYYPPRRQLVLAHHGHFGYVHAALPQRLALPSISGDGGRSREDMEDYYSGGKNKRFRTKFTAEQKEKMLALAERLEWRIQKQDEESVHELCAEVGVERNVLKVWMHNNKHTLGKKT